MSVSSPTEMEGFRVIREGRASIYLPSQAEVFYNPTQVFNRDLSTLVVTQFCKDRLAEDSSFSGARLLDALAASGLRGLRYVREIPAPLLREVVSNDLSGEAVEAMRRNVLHNGPDAARLTPLHSDAIATMTQAAAGERFDVIDLDPYGSPSPFLASAMGAVAPGGLLCVTSTDLQVLCSEAQPDVAYQRYNGVPAAWPGAKEMAVRLCLGSVAAAAARAHRAVEPLLCFYHNHYLRCFVRVHTKPALARCAVSQVGSAFVCSRCGAAAEAPAAVCRAHATAAGQIVFTAGARMPFPAAQGADGRLVCGVCGTTPRLIGGIWTGPIHDAGFLERALATIADEALPDAPGGPGVAPPAQAFAEDGTPYLVTKQQLRAQLLVSAEELDVMSAATAVRRSQEEHAAPAAPTVAVWDCGRLSSLFGLDGARRDVLCAALVAAGHRVSPTHTLPAGFKTTAPAHAVFAAFASISWALNAERAASVALNGLRARQSDRTGLAARLLLSPRPMAEAEARAVAGVLEAALGAEPLPQYAMHTLAAIPADALEGMPKAQAARAALAVFAMPEAPPQAPTPVTKLSREAQRKLHQYLIPQRRRRSGCPALWAEKPPRFGPKAAAIRGAAPKAAPEK